MISSQGRTLLGIKVSRFMRGSCRNIKKRFRKGNEGTPSSIMGDTILPAQKANREKKYKSTLAVAISGMAMGVSHVAAVSGKYRKVVSGPRTLGIGLGVGIVTAGIWYNYIDAAYDGVTEEDISMMFEMANSTGYGSLDDDDGDSAKAVDILHTIVTGKVSDGADKSESMFKYENEDDVDDSDDDDSVFGKKVSFSDDVKTSTSKVSGFGNTGIGKSLFKAKDNGRKSFLPELDKQEAESDEVADGWMDFS